jgi:3-hydroxyacyl-CoA dehydrogenase/enoyl-CoA hydratase/3-hydroxybutyryl-CoA epimerase
MGAYFPKSEIQERLSLAMINEAVLCLDEGIIRSPRDGDIAAVMGLGFPPHLAGPFRFIDNIGAASILNKLENLASKYKSFFEPSKTLIDFAKQNRKFYDELKNTMAQANEIQD